MIATILINCLVVSIAVSIHYEVLSRLSFGLPRLRLIRHRFRVVIGVIGALIAHVAEIWIFAFAYFFMLRSERFGYLQGNFDGSLLDCVYFSFVNYTSLGLGDIEPLGAIRFVTGVEALTGLVLITWTASFMFLEMDKFWHNR